MSAHIVLKVLALVLISAAIYLGLPADLLVKVLLGVGIWILVLA